MAKISSTSIGASPSEGSSSSMTCGLAMSARPMTSICCSPPERYPAWTERRSRSRGKYSYTRTIASCTLRRSGWTCAPATRFSSVVRCSKTRRPSKTWTIPRATISCGPRRSIRAPLNSIEPFVTSPRSERRSPEIALRVVVLPAPLAPSRVVMPPSRTDQDTADLVHRRRHLLRGVLALLPVHLADIGDDREVLSHAGELQPVIALGEGVAPGRLDIGLGGPPDERDDLSERVADPLELLDRHRR